MGKSHSFTAVANGLLNVLKTQCHVSQAFDPSDGELDCARIPFEAIWDTGATASVITQRIADACGLEPISIAQVQGVHGIQESPVYLVNIYLPNKVGFYEVTVTQGNLPPGSGDMLIGMDIIGTCDFSITNKNGITMFSFRHPSQHHLDYIKEDGKNVLRPPITHGGTKKDRKSRHKQYGRNK